MHYFYFIVISLVWGSGFYLMKIAGFAFGPITIGAISTLGGSIVLWSVWAINRQNWNLERRHIPSLAFISFFAYTFPFAVQPFLVGLIGHGFIGMMVSLVPLLTIIVSVPVLGIFPSRVQLFGVLIGIFSIALIIVDGLDRNVNPLFLALALFVPLCYAVTNTMIRKSFSHVPPIILTALFMTSATLVLIPLSLFFEKITIDERFFMALGAIVFISIFARGLAMFLFYGLIQTKGPLFAGMVTYLIPVEVLLWSWFDSERITPTQLCAIAIILLMVGFVQRDISKGSETRME